MRYSIIPCNKIAIVVSLQREQNKYFTWLHFDVASRGESGRGSMTLYISGVHICYSTSSPKDRRECVFPRIPVNHGIWNLAYSFFEMHVEYIKLTTAAQWGNQNSSRYRTNLFRSIKSTKRWCTEYKVTNSHGKPPDADIDEWPGNIGKDCKWKRFNSYRTNKAIIGPTAKNMFNCDDVSKSLIGWEWLLKHV